MISLSRANVTSFQRTFSVHKLLKMTHTKNGRPLISNLDIHPEFVWYFYSDRANLENRIKELKYDFSLNQIPTRAFLANAVQMELLLMEYDLFRCFQLLCLLPKYQNKTLDTIRDKILMLPAKLVSHGHRHTLKLSVGRVDIDLFNLISENITKVKPLI